MATYRVGQKCKMVNCKRPEVLPSWRDCNGDEVEILALPGLCIGDPNAYQITKPKHHSGGDAEYFSPAEFLTPLTDPRADEFIARLERLGREPVIQPVKVEVK